MLNMQFDKLVIVETAAMDWEASPMAGVWRKPLEREAAEHGRTTSIVRYDAGSHFSAHAHPHVRARGQLHPGAEAVTVDAGDDRNGELAHRIAHAVGLGGGCLGGDLIWRRCATRCSWSAESWTAEWEVGRSKCSPARSFRGAACTRS